MNFPGRSFSVASATSLFAGSRDKFFFGECGCFGYGMSLSNRALRLQKLFTVWDDNGSAIDCSTVRSLTDHVATRRVAYGRPVLTGQDGN